MDPPAKLFRYTSKQYAADFVNGKICFSHARTFKNDHLTEAQQDDERVRRFLPERHDDDPLMIQGPDGKLFPVLKMEVHLTNSGSNTPLDYYILCLSVEPHDRMFDEFKASACIEIKDPAAFCARLEKALKNDFPKMLLQGAYMTYFDKTKRPEPGTYLAQLFRKDSSYAYQKEFRAVLLGSTGRNPEDRVFVNVGSLADLCVVHRKEVR